MSEGNNGNKAYRVIITGGGTGGHIFPAIAIANEVKKRNEGNEILFVGARGKMEMEKVPQAGYRIVGVPIAGFNRSSLIKNIDLPVKIVRSFFQARMIIREFRPDLVVGTGGYASFPVLRMAQWEKIPTVIQEQNSFAGKTNIILGKRAKRICVASDGMEKFFPPEKIVMTGNPVRASISNAAVSRDEAIRFFGLDEKRKTLLVLGGSLGAKSVNEEVDAQLDRLLKADLQVIWQTGRPYASRATERTRNKQGVWMSDFIADMEKAYAAADVVVSRAGAIAIAELSLMKKPVVFVPFPYAAEDHQTANALNLVNKHAALMVKDRDAGEKLVDEIIRLANDKKLQEELKTNIGRFAIGDAAKRITDLIYDILRNPDQGRRKLGPNNTVLMKSPFWGLP